VTVTGTLTVVAPPVFKKKVKIWSCEAKHGEEQTTSCLPGMVCTDVETTLLIQPPGVPEAVTRHDVTTLVCNVGGALETLSEKVTETLLDVMVFTWV
jgi:hypothetical protein